MKAVMISIKPEWVEKILNGEKTIEIRKTMPKCELPCKVYIYCTNSYKFALYGVGNGFMLYKGNKHQVNGNMCCGTKLNKRVVAEFTLNKIDLLVDYGAGLHYVDSHSNLIDVDYLRANSCLKDEQIYSYLGLKGDSPYYNDGYAWHIDNLKIYDQPKELSEFNLPECEKSEHACENCKHLEVINTPYAYETNCVKPRKLTKAPQSWCYVEELEAK